MLVVDSTQDLKYDLGITRHSCQVARWMGGFLSFFHHELRSFSWSRGEASHFLGAKID